jgi:hypothetical protein
MHKIALFAEWWHSMNAQAYLLRTGYLDKGLTTASDILHKYSPHSDGNNPDAYSVDVINYMKKYAAILPKAVFPVPVPVTPPVTPPKATQGRKARMRQDSQLWNMTINTKRSPSPKKGDEILVLGNSRTSDAGNRYDEVVLATGKHGWVRYDHFVWI